jgi:hypothetical protein
MNTFLELVQEKFNFLIIEYGFHFVSFNRDSLNFGNSLIRLESDEVGINIILDRSQISIHIGQLSKPDDDWFDFVDLLQYFAPKIKTPYIYPENLIGNERINFQMDRLSQLIKQYCAPIINGDFSMAKKIQKIKLNRIKEMIKEMKKQYPQFKN